MQPNEGHCRALVILALQYHTARSSVPGGTVISFEQGCLCPVKGRFGLPGRLTSDKTLPLASSNSHQPAGASAYRKVLNAIPYGTDGPGKEGS